ncbi:MAG TPA: hypothetical protein VKR99_09515, partial [Candidatus Eremiobacteraceae bacterium]|nr:hypothetical protein [Candidatus Eremiobacteraceae bacterium]
MHPRLSDHPRRLRLTLGVPVAVLIALLITTVQSNAAIVTIVGGTPLKVHIVGQLSSASASPGQTFQIVASEPLTVQGLVVASQGAAGQGHVVAATPAGKNGKGGSITVALDWITAVDGQQLPLSATPQSTAGAEKTGTANTATAVATLVFGPVGLFAHNF